MTPAAGIAVCEQEIKQLRFKKTCMEEFFQDQAEKQKEDIKARRTEISPGMAKFMDDKDVTKINLFLQFLDKCGDDPARAEGHGADPGTQAGRPTGRTQGE